jgi:hypothetical protein
MARMSTTETDTTGRKGIKLFLGGQLDGLRRMGEVADEYGDDWAERRARIAG